MLALVTDAFGGQGGIAQYNRDLLGAFAESGRLASLTILPRIAPFEFYVEAANMTQRAGTRGRASYALRALWQTALARFNLVFCGHLYMAPLARLIAQARRARLIVQMHGIDAWTSPSKPCRAAAEAADLILCVSRHTRARVLDWARVPPERVAVLPNTVNGIYTPGDGTALRQTMGLAGKRILLTVGRLDSRECYKGQDRVIAAIPKLASLGHDIAYLIAGEGDDVSRLRSLALENGTADRVHFLGANPANTLAGLYRMADLFVMPSTGEGFGIAFIEAMACGLPAIGLKTAGACDALADGALGTLVAAEDLPAAIDGALRGPAPDRGALAKAVQARFGRALFVSRAAAMLDKLEGSAGYAH